MSNSSVELLKIPSKLDPQLWALPKSPERSLSPAFLLGGRVRRASFVSIFHSRRNPFCCCRAQRRGLPGPRPGHWTRQVAGGATWSAPSTWSERCGRTEWLVVVVLLLLLPLLLPLRPFQFLAVPPLGRREELRAARLPPRKSCRGAERVSGLVGWLGATGVLRNTRPTCLALLQLRGLLRAFFLPSF